MPTCNECLTPCNCTIEEDGFWANRPQDGRRNVVVEGSGTLLDPITISFMQSEFFRPEAAEVQAPTKSVPTNDNTPVDADDYTVTVYQTPHQVLIKAVGVFVQPLTAFHNYWIVGASATFPANATGERMIEIGTDNADLVGSVRIAGNVQTAVAGASSVLSCAGFTPGLLLPEFSLEGFLYKKAAPIQVALFQTSGGAPMNVTQIKLWVTMI